MHELLGVVIAISFPGCEWRPRQESNLRHQV
jgi:hypothetical protein